VPKVSHSVQSVVAVVQGAPNAGVQKRSNASDAALLTFAF
jgi:hypothetical protein